VRAFIAIDIPDAVKGRISCVQEDFKLALVRPVARDSLHLTVKFLGEADESVIETARTRLGELSATQFKVEVKGISCFRNGFRDSINVVFAKAQCGNGQLTRLFSDVEALTGSIRAENNGHVPHITICRAMPGANQGRIESAAEKYNGHEFGEFIVSEISMKESVFVAGRTEYKDLYRVSLRKQG
jgi:2'-5' RNA ligase